MLKNDYYTYRVIWSVEDNEYVGLCSEFPSLSWLASDQDGALHGIRQLVEDVIIDMKSNGENVPEPLSTKMYSGKFIVRIPPELHRQLAIEASESGISLNRLASDKLSRNTNNQ
jgi:predicted HicB family RNase H-like nuclease